MLCQEYFDPIVSNVANSYRLQEECDVFLGSIGESTIARTGS